MRACAHDLPIIRDMIPFVRVHARMHCASDGMHGVRVRRSAGTEDDMCAYYALYGHSAKRVYAWARTGTIMHVYMCLHRNILQGCLSFPDNLSTCIRACARAHAHIYTRAHPHTRAGTRLHTSASAPFMMCVVVCSGRSRRSMYRTS